MSFPSIIPPQFNWTVFPPSTSYSLTLQAPAFSPAELKMGEGFFEVLSVPMRQYMLPHYQKKKFTGVYLQK